jgi:hypothetical protein
MPSPNRAYCRDEPHPPNGCREKRILVAEYHRFAEDCRELAAHLSDICEPDESHALTQMAAAREKVAEQRGAGLKEQLGGPGAEPV